MSSCSICGSRSTGYGTEWSSCPHHMLCYTSERSSRGSSSNDGDGLFYIIFGIPLLVFYFYYYFFLAIFYTIYFTFIFVKENHKIILKILLYIIIFYIFLNIVVKISTGMIEKIKMI